MCCFLCRCGSKIAEPSGGRESVLARCNRSGHTSLLLMSCLFLLGPRTMHRYQTNKWLSSRIFNNYSKRFIIVSSPLLFSFRSRTLRGSGAAVEHLQCQAASCLVTLSPPACPLTLIVMEASLTSWVCPVQGAATWDRHIWAAFLGDPQWAGGSMAMISMLIQTASPPA